ncbi:MAG: D-alanine--D-alanine ligase family protein [Candidatus Saccharimonadales bacterium]
METVAVIFGGRSAEHDVSIVTALASVIKPLELSKKYKVEAVYIAKNGAWYWDDKLKDIKLFTSGKIEDFISKSQPVSLRFDGGLQLVKTGSSLKRGAASKIDVVFPAMHGTYGEDGALMGLLDMAGVPYVGCGLSASVLAMDKILAKQVAAAASIPVTKFINFTKLELENKYDAAVKKIEKELNYPLFVKPASLGSSIGISRVKNSTELANGLEVAAHYDEKILVEEAVENLIEVTLPIMGNDDPIPALLEQPLTQAEDFFDFDTKYLQGGKKGGKGTKGAQGYSKIPADLPEKLYKSAEQTGLDVYKALGCSGIARVDMLIDNKTEKVYFNEVNPLPGGLYSHNWNKAGVSNVELVQKLIGFAKERYAARQKSVTTFSTNYLKQF